MKKILLATITACIAHWGNGQELRLTQPVKLSAAVNSQYDESNPLLSEDGKTLYFVRTGAPENSGGEPGGQDVWVSQLENGGWSNATNRLDEINNGDNNAVVGASEDGNKLFLINSYSANPRRNRGVVFTTRTGDAWIAPRELDLVLHMKSDFYGFYMTPEEDILLISMKSQGSMGEEDLYVSFRNVDSTWTEPLHLGESVNSSGFEISPFLSKDKQTLYFSSNGQGGHGSADIFKSTRLDDSWTKWSQPENLGSEINTSGFEAYFSIYDDKAFFCSTRDGSQSDIFAIGIQAPKEDSLFSEKEDEEIEEVADAPAEEVVAKEKAAPVKMETEVITLYFAFDEFKVVENDIALLTKKLEKLKQAEEIIITGYTDNQGPEAYNLHLSEKRAESVAQELLRRGISAEKIETRAQGENAPVASNDILEQRKKNRRVEIVLR